MASGSSRLVLHAASSATVAQAQDLVEPVKQLVAALNHQCPPAARAAAVTVGGLKAADLLGDHGTAQRLKRSPSRERPWITALVYAVPEWRDAGAVMCRAPTRSSGSRTRRDGPPRRMDLAPRLALRPATRRALRSFGRLRQVQVPHSGLGHHRRSADSRTPPVRAPSLGQRGPVSHDHPRRPNRH